MRFSDDTREFRHWTLPEAIVALLRVLHRNLSSSFDLFSLGSKMGPGGLLFEDTQFQWGEAYLLFVCHLFCLYAWFLTDIPLLPHAKIFHLMWKQGTLPWVFQLCFHQQIKCLSRKFDWDFVWPLNWVDRARAWLSANTVSNGELERGGSIELPVTFTQLA